MIGAKLKYHKIKICILYSMKYDLDLVSFTPFTKQNKKEILINTY